MAWSGPNHPFVIWAACFLWMTSVFEIAWSLLLFFCVGDILLLTGTDLVNALVLLSGIIMLPTNIHMLYAISQNYKIEHKTKVVCCPLWLCLTWIMFINCIGIVLCIQRIYSCQEYTYNSFYKGMVSYKGTPKYKHLVDDIQWSLKCCGLKSYKDWFDKKWFDSRDIGFDYLPENRDTREVDSVPLSCCKTGLCSPNYLLELGPSSINTTGCGHLLIRIVIISMTAHIVMFLTVIVVEIIILKYIISGKNKKTNNQKRKKLHVRNVMSVNNNYEFTSGSCQIDPEESETSEPSADSKVKMGIYNEADDQSKHLN